MKGADVLEDLARYARERTEESETLSRFRALLERTQSPFSRAQYQPGHLTCSACVLSADGARAVLLHHAKLGRWLQPGGHIEAGDAAPLASARREVLEESGLRELDALPSPDGTWLLDLDIHTIPAHGAEPLHLHYDLRYALLVRSADVLLRSEESDSLRWVEISRLRELTDEESVRRLVDRAQQRFRNGQGVLPAR